MFERLECYLSKHGYNLLLIYFNELKKFFLMNENKMHVYVCCLYSIMTYLKGALNLLK